MIVIIYMQNLFFNLELLFKFIYIVFILYLSCIYIVFILYLYCIYIVLLFLNTYICICFINIQFLIPKSF